MGDLSESKCGQCPGTCGARSLSLHSSSPLTLTSISCSVSSFGATTTKLAGALLAACRQTRRDGTRISFHGFVFFWCVCVFLVGFLFVWFVDFGFVPFNRTFIPRQLFFGSPYSPPCSVCVCVCAASIPSKSIYSKDQCVAIKLGCCRTLRFRWGTRPAQSTNTERFHAPAHSGAGILSTDFIPEPAEAIAEHRFSPHAVGSKSIE